MQMITKPILQITKSIPATRLILLLLITSVMALSCSPSPTERERTEPERVEVIDGVMVWESGEEVSLFGVNYQPAFAHSHRALRILGKDHKEAIREDTYHFSRMRFDAYRIHMWDREITDSLGNLLQNEHLDLHDYTIHQMSQRDIRTIMTPTTYYSNAYPDGATPAPGFSNYISKGQAPQVPEYRPVIKNYLTQLIQHRNPYTGMTAIEDPNIIALEIDNEPSHSGYERTLDFVNELAGHLRDSGWNKPIFYNITHGVPEAYLDADIDGVTFQWYPAGLVNGEAIRKNYFPYVNSYPTPWEEDPGYQEKAQMVYEFDPADTMHRYALPMMARSFREAGMQWATQFAYDPLAFAHQNSDYPTHFLNFAYTPGKAVSALIASEIFNRIERRQQFDNFPADTAFGDFLMSHHLDLSQLNAEDAFIHSNHTESVPKAEASLERIAGVGTSPIVNYQGTGAYFLDKLKEGVWRLEVMPDAIQVRDPFERPDYGKHVVHLNWREHPMEIRLADLGRTFSISGLNEGNRRQISAENGSFTISPGSWLLTRNGVSSEEWGPDSWFGAIRIGEFHAPASNAEKPVVWHRPVDVVESGRPFTVSANIAGLRPGESVMLRVNPSQGQNQTIEMEETSPYRFEADIPAETVSLGVLQYWIVVDRGEDEYLTFPGANPSAPWRWNFFQMDEHWQIAIADPAEPFEIWNAGRDFARTSQGFSGFGGNSNQTSLSSSDRPGELAWEVSTTNPTSHRSVLGLATDLSDRVAGMHPATLNNYQNLVVRARTDYNLPAPLKVVLVDGDGNSYSAAVPVTRSWQGHTLPLASFSPDRFMLLPRSYPGITESWYETGVSGPVRARDIQEIQFYIDTTDGNHQDGERYGFEIQSAWLE